MTNNRRDRYAAAISAGGHGQSLFELVSAAMAVADEEIAEARTLTPAERAILAYALNVTQEHIWYRDRFTDEDQAAVTSLRRFTEEKQS